MNNVKDFGAKGDGTTDDTLAIRQAIDYVKSQNGGQIYFPSGVYVVTDTLTIDSPVGFVGEGSSTLSLTTNGTYNNVTTLLSWHGPEKVMIDYVGRIEGVVFMDLAIHGRNTASTGIRIDRLRHSLFRCVTINGFKYFGLDLKPRPEANAMHDNCMFNHFQNLSIRNELESASCLRLDGTVLDKYNINAGAGNSCHNTFTNTHLWVNKNWNVEFLDCDNNSFYMLYCFKIDKSSQMYFGYNADTYNSAYIPRHGCARSNYIYHCQGTIYASAGPTSNAPECKNYIFGYDRENGQVLPVTNNNAKIIIVGEEQEKCSVLGKLFN